jgi:sigma54-dependent transcription regulator
MSVFAGGRAVSALREAWDTDNDWEIAMLLFERIQDLDEANTELIKAVIDLKKDLKDLEDALRKALDEYDRREAARRVLME